MFEQEDGVDQQMAVASSSNDDAAGQTSLTSKNSALSNDDLTLCASLYGVVFHTYADEVKSAFDDQISCRKANDLCRKRQSLDQFILDSITTRTNA